MSRKLSIALGLASLAVLTAAGPLSAKPVTGTPGDDVLTGTPLADTIHGLAGNDDISPGKGDDRAFGDGGFDRFSWKSHGGHDRINGGADDDGLEIEAGRYLNLHLDALGTGPERASGGGLQVIGVKNIEQILVSGTDRSDRLVLSSDPFSLSLGINTGLGDDRIDTRGLQVSASIRPGLGDDEIRLGKGRNRLFYEFETGDEPPLDAERGHDTIFGFGDNDTIELGEAHPFGSGPATFLDTNNDGKLTAKDRTVRVRDGSMTIDLSRGTFASDGGKITVTLVGRTSVDIHQIINLTD